MLHRKNVSVFIVQQKYNKFNLEEYKESQDSIKQLHIQWFQINSKYSL